MLNSIQNPTQHGAMETHQLKWKGLHKDWQEVSDLHWKIWKQTLRDITYFWKEAYKERNVHWPTYIVPIKTQKVT